ncbi:MAG: integrase arm-type DNA-binding domain-containing protein, partial [Mariprofundaceae bacterium]|nr:integrase arm-type DNA-binding domain-containing protein [Mariprofundaceae bacterium]
MSLTAVKIRNLKRPKSGRPVRVHDGNGLFFFRGVRKDVWKLRLRDKAGKEQWLTLGEHPPMSLKEARQAAEAARHDAHAGRKKPTATFREIALRWLEHAGSDWAPKTHQKHLTWLRKDVFPRIGDKRPDEIQATDILALLRRVEAAGHLHKVRKLHSIIERIFSFAISHGEATANPAAALNCRDLFKKEQRENRPAFTTAKDVARLMRLIWAY